MQLLAESRYDATRCVGCKGCTWVDHIYMPGVRFGMKCPSAAYNPIDSYAPYGRAKILLELLDGRLPFSSKVADVIYSCALCGACDAGCKRNLDLEPMLLLERLRQQCVKEGFCLPEHQEVSHRIQTTHNYFGYPHQDRSNWLAGINLPANSEAEYIYFAGCSSSYEQTAIAKAVINILQQVGIKASHLGSDEWCCGYSIIASGQTQDASKTMAHNLAAIERTGITNLLVSCAECYHTWKVEYPKLAGKSTEDMGYRVVHLSELLAQLVTSGQLLPQNHTRVKAVYHDPCNLGRKSEPWVHWEGVRGRFGVLSPAKEYRRGTFGVYQQPRDIIQSIPGIELLEMPRRKENAWCCGYGGGLRDAFQDQAEWSAQERLIEAESVGAELIITACPWCKTGLQQAANKHSSRLKVMDLAELLI